MKTYADRHDEEDKKKRHKEIYGYDRLQRQIQSMTDEEREEMHRYAMYGGYMRPKLEVSQPNDPAEQQADTVAESFTSGNIGEGANILSHQPADVSPMGDGDVAQTSDEFDQQLYATKGQGHPLDDETRSELEEHTGADLSDVNIHTGSEAGEMSESINARAFAHGQDIYFNEGEFDTESEEGKELLAHEVAHTVQEGGGLQPKIQRMDDPGVISDRAEKYKNLTLGQLTSQLSTDTGKDYSLSNLQFLFFNILKGGANLWKNQVILYYLMERGWQVDVDPIPLWATHKYVWAGGKNALVIYTPMTGQLGVDVAYGYIYDKKLLERKYETETYDSFYYYAGEENRDAFDLLESEPVLITDVKAKKAKHIGYAIKSEMDELTFSEPLPSKQAIVIAKKKVEDFQTKEYIKNPGIAGYGDLLPHSSDVEISNVLDVSPQYSYSKYGKPANTIDSDNLKTAEDKFINGNNYTPGELIETGKKANNLLKFFEPFRQRVAAAVIYADQYANSVSVSNYKVFSSYEEAIITAYKDPSQDIPALFKTGDDELKKYKTAVQNSLLGDQGAVKKNVDQALELLKNNKKDKFLNTYGALTKYIEDHLNADETKRSQIISGQISPSDEDPGILINDTNTLLGAVSILASYASLNAFAPFDSANITRDYRKLHDICFQMQADVGDQTVDDETKQANLKKTVDEGYAFITSDQYKNDKIAESVGDWMQQMKDQAEKDFIKLCVVFVAAYAAGEFALAVFEEVGVSFLTVVETSIVGGVTVTLAGHAAETLLEGKSFTKGLATDMIKNSLLFMAVSAVNIGYTAYSVRIIGLPPTIGERFLLSFATIQFLSEVDHNFETGKPMTGTERAESMFNNVLLAALSGFEAEKAPQVEDTLGVASSPEFKTNVDNLREARTKFKSAVDAKDPQTALSAQNEVLKNEQAVYDQFRKLPPDQRPADYEQRLSAYEAALDKNNAEWELEFAKQGLDIQRANPEDGLFRPRGRGVVEYNGAKGLEWAKKLNPGMKETGQGVWRAEGSDGEVTYFVENGKAFIPTEEIQPISSPGALDIEEVTPGGKGYKVKYKSGANNPESVEVEYFEEGGRYYRSETSNGKTVTREVSKYEFLKVQLKYYLSMFNKAVLKAGSAAGKSVNMIFPGDPQAYQSLYESIYWLVKAGIKSVELVIEYLKGEPGFENIDWTKQENKDILQKALDEAKIKSELVSKARAEFDAYGLEWLKEDPFTGESLFDEETGGYVVIHKHHNITDNYQNEINMAKCFMSDGYRVKLLDERPGEPGDSTPDAEIIGYDGVFDFKNISEKALTKNIQGNVRDAVLGEASTGENTVFTLQNNTNASIEIINEGVKDAIETADESKSGLPEMVGLVYRDGKVKLITIEDFRKGSRF